MIAVRVIYLSMMRGNHIVSLLIVSGVASVLLLDGNALFRLPAQRTAVPVDDLLFQGLQDPFALLIPAFAPYRGLRLSEPPQAYESYVVPGMFLSLILAITMGLANVSGRMRILHEEG